MNTLDALINGLSRLVWDFPRPIPFIVLALVSTGVFLTLRLRLIQVRGLWRGVRITAGLEDAGSETGEVSHFQALTTALSATVGIGNIAGVAIAIHYGGPGALFWMWCVAALGMAVKYTEVTLAQRFRVVTPSADGGETVSGGPMHYIERGLGPRWRPLALFFAGALSVYALSGNAIQANSLADVGQDAFGWAPWATGLVAAAVVGVVILGGIRRIGRVTAVLTPVMAGLYVLGALAILALNADAVLPTLALIVREAFDPTAGVAGAGAGAFLTTMLWGIRRGLYSNEAGQGSAPIAHAAAKTDEPVTEGLVALLEPFIDTILICTLTGLVILTTGAWGDPVPTRFDLGSADASVVALDADGVYQTAAPDAIDVREGAAQGAQFAWVSAPVAALYEDEARTRPFTGALRPAEGAAVTAAGTRLTTLYGDAPVTGAPLTALAFARGLSPLGDWGGLLVVVSTILFAVSTSIAWSYYGDRTVTYLFGERAALPYRVLYVGMHFVGAIVPLTTVWALGDVLLGIVTFPNLIALVLLSGLVRRMTTDYFARR
ncbi:alanine/glycine:cation symporter family protein [Rubrivirga sp. IMCC43871]|uniref:alanine/glycine:cation symporter family protein n=1 Tax=Rubrivirga sp. IMCC43871 TaxID=3391575 RepID=UPI00398FB7AC